MPVTALDRQQLTEREEEFRRLRNYLERQHETAGTLKADLIWSTTVDLCQFRALKHHFDETPEALERTYEEVMRLVRP